MKNNTASAKSILSRASLDSRKRYIKSNIKAKAVKVLDFIGQDDKWGFLDLYLFS